MAAIDIRTTDASSFIGIESTYGTTPSMTRIYPVADSFEVNVEQTELDVDDESALLYDYKNPVVGLESCKPKFTVYARPDATQLTQAASPATPWLGTILKAALGGEVTPAAGSNIVTGSTTTSLNVTDSEGSRLTAYVPFLVDVGGVPEPTFATAIATGGNPDVATLGLALSTTPTAGEDIINTYTYYPTASNTTTFTLQHAYAGNSARQWTMNGCVATGLSIDVPRDGLIKIGVEAMGSVHTGPSAQSISVAYAADPMNPPFGVRESIFVLQSTSTTTRTHYPIHSFAAKLNLGMTLIPEVGGTTEGVVGAMRTGERLFAEFTVRIRADNVRDTTDWVSRTDMFMLFAVPRGSGSTKQWLIIYAPKVVIVGKPKAIREGARDLMELTLRTKVNTSGTPNNVPFCISIG
jgi:hypothetical protein